MTRPVRLKEVDGKSERFAAMLHWLQLEALPYDTPMATDEGHWWVAFDGTLPVAFAGVKGSESVPGAAYLCRAGVLPSHRGLGLQRRLIAVRERKSRKLGYAALVTDTFDNSHSSNNLIAAGFRQWAPPVRYGAEGTNYWRKNL